MKNLDSEARRRLARDLQASNVEGINRRLKRESRLMLLAYLLVPAIVVLLSLVFGPVILQLLAKP